MLVLSRKAGESIQIDAEIQIKVVSIGNGRIKLGVNAPHHMRILRKELIDRGTGMATTRENTWPQHVKNQEAVPPS